MKQKWSVYCLYPYIILQQTLSSLPMLLHELYTVQLTMCKILQAMIYASRVTDQLADQYSVVSVSISFVKKKSIYIDTSAHGEHVSISFLLMHNVFACFFFFSYKMGVFLSLHNVTNKGQTKEHCTKFRLESWNIICNWKQRNLPWTKYYGLNTMLNSTIWYSFVERACIFSGVKKERKTYLYWCLAVC